MATRTEPSFCRTCGGLCGVKVTLDEADRLVSVEGDKRNPLTQGFACIKGLNAPAFHNHPDRILHPLKRMPDGRFERISQDQALDEIAAKVAEIIAEDGPGSVATFRGTQNYTDTLGSQMLPAWSQAIGSPAFFSTMTVDQSAKWVAAERLGVWQAGYQSFLDADVWLFAGINPVVSLWGGNAFPPFNPVKRMKEARARGMTIIVIDPRLTETAKFADIVLQPKPGEDVTIAAGLLNIILGNSWHDADFCQDHVADLEALRRAVAPFTPDYVEARAGVPGALLIKAAQAFARDGRRGVCTTGTGPNMAQRSNLAEHLYECLNVICGRYIRAGETLKNPGVMGPRRQVRAQVIPAARTFEKGLKTRVGGYGMMNGQMMSGALVEEILAPGSGRIRSLFVVGGNPAMAFPDQLKTVRALSALDLLVAIEPMMTGTAKLAHYILPPRLQYERADLPLPGFERVFPIPYAQYTPAIARPPEGSEVAEEWWYFWALAKRLGRQIRYFGQDIDMETAPTAEQMLAMVTARAAVPFAQLQAERVGAVIEVEASVVGEPDGRAGKFEVAAPDILAEIALVAAETAPDHGFTHHLISRRMRELQNTMGLEVAAIRARRPVNPAWLHSQDLAAQGLRDGDRVELTSRAGSIIAEVAADDSVRPGVIAMTHGWGGLPGEQGQPGVATSLLISSDHDVEPINAMPVMSAIPVRMRPA